MNTISVTNVTAYLRAAFPALTFVANEFAATNPDDCAFVRMQPGFAPSEWTTKRIPGFQIVIRAKNPGDAEARANAIYAELHGKSEFMIGPVRVIKCVSDQSAPIYLGKDESQRTMYSLNFNITIL